MIDENDLRIEVSQSAYEKHSGESASKIDPDASRDGFKYKSGVYILHIPSGKSAYSNSEKSQIGNKIKALKELEVMKWD